MLTVFFIVEDHEAVINHVSRTQRVDLDYFDDRMNKDPMIQIRYVTDGHN